MKIIAITGGIGTGKSMVSEILRVMGYKVYDCDSAAKSIMDTDASIIGRIEEDIDFEAIIHRDGRPVIDRKRLSDTVFSCPEKLQLLNSLVHGAVRKDFISFIEKETERKSDLLFFETAILFSSEMDKLADFILRTDAPDEIRFERLERRGLTYEEAKCRIKSQEIEEGRIDKKTTLLINDGLNPILPAIQKFIRKITEGL